MYQIIQELNDIGVLNPKYQKGYYKKDGLIIIPLKENVGFRIQRLKEIEAKLKAKGYNANPYGSYGISIKIE